MVTLVEIKEVRKGRRTYFPYSRWVLHPIANYLVWIAVRLGVTPNQVTVLSCIVGMIGCSFLAIGNHTTIVIGGLLLLIYVLLDCVDGAIARVTTTTTKYGQFIDVSAAYIIGGLVPLSIGLGLYFKTDMWWYLLISGVCASAYLLGTAISLLQGIIFTSKIQVPGSGTANKIHITLLEVPIIIACAIFNYLEAYLFLYTAIYTYRVIGIMYAIRKGQ